MENATSELANKCLHLIAIDCKYCPLSGVCLFYAVFSPFGLSLLPDLLRFHRTAFHEARLRYTASYINEILTLYRMDRYDRSQKCKINQLLALERCDLNAIGPGQNGYRIRKGKTGKDTCDW